ncbi:MAG TPA: hypothetical protein VHC21_02415 [Candidatus Saccharimonadales bacterium]|nr:hypothetical protein [Candidatus Saccharimonadales bacterium]
MTKHNQDGAVSGVAVSLVFTLLLLIAAIVFGVWAFGSRQDYKNNTDAKINAAVTVAKQNEDKLKDAAFAQAEKNPLTTWNGPEAYGSIALAYPKTWSGYVSVASSTNTGSTNPVDGYFYPGVVPSTTDSSSSFALRIQVNSQSYANVVQQLSQANSQNPPTVAPYALPKVPKVVGVKVTGTLPISNGDTQKTGIMVILPLRSETLEIWTEGSQFTADFNNSILPNFSFSP